METNEIIIRSPIWKTRSVGVADYKITKDIVVKISYKTTTGERLYPDPLFMTREKAKQYPTQTVSGVTLRIIPIDHFEVKNGL